MIRLIAADFADLAARAAASMTPQHIEAARLALVEDLPSADIARSLGLPSDADVSRAVSALLAFRDAPRESSRGRSLSQAEFDSIMPLFLARGTSATRIEAARLALVERLPDAEVMHRFGWRSRQSVSLAKGIALSLYDMSKAQCSMPTPSTGSPPDLPPGWVLLTLAAPAELADRFRREVEAFRLGSKKKPGRKDRA